MDQKEDITNYWRKACGEKITPNEKQLLFDLAQKVASDFEQPTIVNIGVSWGASLHCLVAGAPKGIFVAIDCDYKTRPLQGYDIIEQITGKADPVLFLEGKSQSKRIVSYLYKPLHLVFVDGCHSYGCVKADAENFTLHIPIGGMIVFHDYAPEPKDRKRLEGVERAVDEWQRNDTDWIQVFLCDSIIVFERVR